MSQIVLDTLVVAASVLLAASAIIALYRIVRGPSILDRMIATDVVLASIMCGLGGFMALSGRTDLLPVLIVLAMLGFVGSVSVSRYVSKSDSMTPGAEVGSLSEFSNSDWHMPKDSPSATASGTADETEEWPDDVARGISDVSDGPDAITVQGDEEIHPVTVGLDQGTDPGADLSDDEDAGAEFEPDDEGPTAEDPNGADPDVDGEGEGTGPDAGPDDSDDGARTSPEPDDEGSRR
ncbi:monovalent cation/H+ antiporter complex subunit F [Brevibacterium aurantiacum]|uniref:Multisubunit Na+/H+ antiporter, MnhF subunit n=1 Tax=Brevibacterium aurantiacum TaxID=273384 RepID=A0A2A3X309_BREAU|nr:monovalent cation/H+ antiporter complex subunit F [Brevibacterium aurantiacum]PCC18039.1 sodium:proton antiporter [Brevibacterium aurantiacum]PCC43027.1 sodium:proton antiporter [Brevibacterium aurantiacum]PCC47528.1 sodium:proton antiporter [Brevibacterium aurantiacum]PCC51798.1 sodium:proton antiporter [Brevibacterium aurantiacum]TGD39280.1 sodium:proton antiporter [Brevibacterium aurantiacum]